MSEEELNSKMSTIQQKFGDLMPKKDHEGDKKGGEDIRIGPFDR